MMYIHSNNEIDKKDKRLIANNISTIGNNCTAAGCNMRHMCVNNLPKVVT